MKENAQTAYKALIDYQQMYGYEALTTNERNYLNGVITYNEFKEAVTYTNDSPGKD